MEPILRQELPPWRDGAGHLHGLLMQEDDGYGEPRDPVEVTRDILNMLETKGYYLMRVDP